MSTSLVNVDATAASKLCSFVREVLGEAGEDFQQQCETHNGNVVELLQCVLNKSNEILAMENEKDAEGCFQAVVAVLQSSGCSDDDELKVVSSLVKCLAASDNSAVVLRVYVCVFNLLRSAASKFQILKGLFSYAIKSNQASLVAQFESHVSNWVTSWNLSLPEQRELYVLVADTLFATDQNSRALFFLTQYLNTFDAGAYPQEVVGVATKAIVSAITSPVSLYKERNDLSKILAGRSTTDQTLLKLIDLLRIFCSGTVEEYMNFYNANKDLLNKFNVNHETSLRNMRLLGLCVLAARSTSGSAHVLSYSDIAKTLEVSSDEEVEEWVVEAISHGLLDASMDQLNGVIVVSRSARVSFDHNEWVTLQQKLSLWRNNLTGVLEAMKSHQNEQ